jgi:hypothetical protein
MDRIARLLVLALSGFVSLFASAQVLTVQVGAPSAPHIPLVEHTNTWHWHKGTNAPTAGWRSNSDASLDDTWGSGPGGFGYSTDTPNETNQCRTILSDMLGSSATNYSTFYIRRTFTIDAGADTNAHLLLTVDFDDGFIAWLDGVYITNRLVTGAPAEPAFTAVSSANHESSRGSSGLPAETYDLGPIGSRAGTHVLAIMGLNGNKNTSSDFVLIADLAMTDSTGAYPSGAFGTLVTSNSVALTGSNSVAGTTRVTVNGEDAAYNTANKTWSRAQTLKPGMNRLYVAAVDAVGNVLSNITTDVIYQTTATNLNGTLASSTLLSGGGTVAYVTGSLTVPTNVTFEVADGAVVLVTPGQRIITQAGGRIYVHGTFDDPVFFNVNGTSTANWGPLSGTGTNSSIELHFADIAHAQVNATTNALGLIEDTAIHDFDPGAGAGTQGRPIMLCNFASLFTARRLHVYNYWECLVRNGVIQVEHCLFELLEGDALDFDSAQPGSYTRNCTYRHGNRGNADAVDIGPGDLPGSTDTRIENCIMWDFPFDKGVSVGDGVVVGGVLEGSSHGIIVSNCLIYGCNAGVMAKSLCDVSVRNCTIVGNDSGLTNYNKTNPGTNNGGGITTNTYNNIIWNNITAFGLANDSQLYADHNDFGNTNWPGEGNIDVDPLFVNPAIRDYGLQAGSPCLTAGRDGAYMGVTYPLGGIPARPLRLSVLSNGTNDLVVKWVDDSQNEDGVIVQRSSDGINWTTIATLPPNSTNHTDTTTLLDDRYYYRVQHTNYVGVSPYSNIAVSQRQGPATFVGGTIDLNTVWSGTIVVTSSVVVPNGVQLSVAPGAQVRMNGNFSITAQAGGTIEVQGEAGNRVRFIPHIGTAGWGNIAGTGNGASVTVRFAELWRGGINLANGAIGLIEDCFIHHVSSAIVGNSAASVTVRRVHVSDYAETIYNSTLVLVEDSLFENLTSNSSDAVEIQGSPLGCIVRRSTIRNGTGSNTDGFDCNGSRNVLIADCLIYGFTDKAISFGAASAGSQTCSGMVVSNCLIYNANIGIAVKDGATASFYHNTIVDTVSGLALYQKFPDRGGGEMTNGYNNIIFNNVTNVGVYDGSTLVTTYSDIEGTNWPGVGNISAAPLFQNAVARDYRLGVNSPARGTGLNDRDMGAIFPNGAFTAPSHPVIRSFAVDGDVTLSFWADPRRTYSVQSVDDFSTPLWTNILNVPTNVTTRLLELTNSADPAMRFYRLVTPIQP